MAKALSNITEAPELLRGREVLNVEVVRDTKRDSDEDASYIVLYFEGLRVYADAPAVYSDDSGDVPAAF